MPTQMQNLLVAVIKVDKELISCQANNKLSGPAFLAEAKRICRCDEKRLKEFGKVLDDPLAGTQAINAFVNSVEKFIEDHTPRPPPAEKMAKVGRVYGNDDLAAELAMVGFTVADAFCYATKMSTERRPERYGVVRDMDQHAAHVQRLIDKRKSLIQQMADTISGADIEYNDDGATIRGSDVVLKAGWQVNLMGYVAGLPKKSRARIKEAA